MEAPIVITGVSALTAFGLGAQAYAHGARSGTVTHQPIAGSYVSDVVCAQVPTYDAKKLLAVRSISAFDRLTLHICVTVDDLLKQLRLADPAGRSDTLADERIGLVLGSSGPIQSILEIDLQTLDEPRYVQPSIVPNVVFNVPASYAAIRHRIRGSCVTLTDGDTSSLKALAMAMHQLESGRTDICLTGGAEEATPAYALMRAGRALNEQQPCPPLTEGAVMFALERRGEERVTDAPSLAGVFGTAQAFSPGDTVAGLQHCLAKLRHRFADRLREVSAVFHAAQVDPQALGLGAARAYASPTLLGHPGAMGASLSILDMLSKPEIKPGETVLLLEADAQGTCAAALLEKHATVPAGGDRRTLC